MNTSRIEQGFNLNWIKANPELFGKAIADLLTRCPPDQWAVAITPAYMPGEKFMIVCTPKEQSK
jgi:hypothetical protein